MSQVTPEQVHAGKMWLKTLGTRGLTDIFVPLKKACKMLNNPEISVGRIPMVLLITDGCVNNEKEIVNWAKMQAGSVRVFTLGIGP